MKKIEERVMYWMNDLAVGLLSTGQSGKGLLKGFLI